MEAVVVPGSGHAWQGATMLPCSTSLKLPGQHDTAQERFNHVLAHTQSFNQSQHKLGSNYDLFVGRLLLSSAALPANTRGLDPPAGQAEMSAPSNPYPRATKQSALLLPAPGALVVVPGGQLCPGSRFPPSLYTPTGQGTTAAPGAVAQ